MKKRTQPGASPKGARRSHGSSPSQTKDFGARETRSMPSGAMSRRRALPSSLWTTIASALCRTRLTTSRLSSTSDSMFKSVPEGDTTRGSVPQALSSGGSRRSPPVR